MTIELTLPQPSLKKKNSKDLILSILMSEPELSAVRIYNQIKKQFGISLTYRAVHKSLKLLLEEGVLTEQGNRYSINLTWIKEIRDFATKVEKSYPARFAIKGLRSFKTEGNLTILSFNTIKDADYYIMELKQRMKKPLVAHCKHFWWSLVYTEKMANYISNAKSKVYGLCQGNTYLDRYCTKQETKLGFISKSGVKCADVCDLYIHDDFVIQVFYPAELIRRIDRLYKKCENIEKLDLKELVDYIFKKKATTQLIIDKNNELADQIMLSTMKVFK